MCISGGFGCFGVFFFNTFFTVLVLFFRISSQFAAPFKHVFKEETCSLEKVTLSF